MLLSKKVVKLGRRGMWWFEVLGGVALGGGGGGGGDIQGNLHERMEPARKNKSRSDRGTVCWVGAGVRAGGVEKRQVKRGSKMLSPIRTTSMRQKGDSAKRAFWGKLSGHVKKRTGVG